MNCITKAPWHDDADYMNLVALVASMQSLATIFDPGNRNNSALIESLEQPELRLHRNFIVRNGMAELFSIDFRDDSAIQAHS